MPSRFASGWCSTRSAALPPTRSPRRWERQLDIKYNHLFYDGKLTAPVYEAWLHKVGVRFVASSDARLDYSAHKEAALIAAGVPDLRLVFRSRHWRVYAVRNPTAI